MDIIQAPAELNAAAAMLWAWAVEFLPRIGSAALILIAGYFAARWTARVVATLIQSALAIDLTLIPPIAAVIRYAILIFVFVATLSQLGIQTASVLAALGAAGLAIGLALQGTLSNIAAGMMLLWLRPFRVGDYIETAAVSGSVREIGLFVTELETFDGIFRFVPNSEIWNKPLVNYTRNAARLLNISIGIRLEDDAGKAMSIVRDAIGERVATVPSAPPSEVFIDSLADNFVYIGVRAWLPSATYWSAHRSLVATLKANLDEAGIPVQRLLHPAPDTGNPMRRYESPPARGLLAFAHRARKERGTKNAGAAE